MNESEARELEGVLSESIPDGKVTVTPEPGGAEIVIDGSDGVHSYTIGDGPSRLLTHLLAG